MAGKIGALATIRQVRIDNERENVIIKHTSLENHQRPRPWTWGGIAIGGKGNVPGGGTNHQRMKGMGLMGWWVWEQEKGRGKEGKKRMAGTLAAGTGREWQNENTKAQELNEMQNQKSQHHQMAGGRGRTGAAWDSLGHHCTVADLV